MSEIADRSTRFQFSLRGLLLATLVVAWTLPVNRWLGEVYGWRTAPACGIIAALILLVDYRTASGGVIGAITLAMIGYFFVVDSSPTSPRFFKAMLVFVAFGGATGCSFNAFLLRHWMLGGITLFVSIAGFVTILIIN